MPASSACPVADNGIGFARKELRAKSKELPMCREAEGLSMYWEAESRGFLYNIISITEILSRETV
jgi:hypothetical protein